MLRIVYFFFRWATICSRNTDEWDSSSPVDVILLYKSFFILALFSHFRQLHKAMHSRINLRSWAGAGTFGLAQATAAAFFVTAAAETQYERQQQYCRGHNNKD